MKQVRKTVLAIFLLLALAIQSVPLAGAMEPAALAESGSAEKQPADAGTSNETAESAEDRYVEDLSTVDWDNVIDTRICLREDEDVVPEDYEWTVEDFPELELEDVFDNGYSIYPILKTGGRESLTYAIEQMASYCRRCRLDRAGCSQRSGIQYAVIISGEDRCTGGVVVYYREQDTQDRCDRYWDQRYRFGCKSW